MVVFSAVIWGVLEGFIGTKRIPSLLKHPLFLMLFGGSCMYPYLTSLTNGMNVGWALGLWEIIATVSYVVTAALLTSTDLPSIFTLKFFWGALLCVGGTIFLTWGTSIMSGN